MFDKRIKKIILGSAQFGINYGINKKERIRKKDVFEILDFARSNGIKAIDTAAVYGDAEKVIGEYAQTRRVQKSLHIVTKCSGKTAFEIKQEITKSFLDLKTRKIYGILIHKFDNFKNNHKIYKELIDLKKAKKIEKIGFSLYYPREIEYLLKREVPIDILEVPYNLFDQRFEILLEKLKKKRITIYARSIFLQGLLFKKENEVGKFFSKVKGRLNFLNEISKQDGLSISEICLNFVLLNKNIDNILIGVHNLNDLKENIKSLKKINKVKKIYNKLFLLKFSDEKIILPTNWPK